MWILFAPKHYILSQNKGRCAESNTFGSLSALNYSTFVTVITFNIPYEKRIYRHFLRKQQLALQQRVKISPRALLYLLSSIFTYVNKSVCNPVLLYYTHSIEYLFVCFQGVIVKKKKVSIIAES
jgi:hypothetical protein